MQITLTDITVYDSSNVKKLELSQDARYRVFNSNSGYEYWNNSNQFKFSHYLNSTNNYLELGNSTNVLMSLPLISSNIKFHRNF